jgi:GrpB-like predicted nucleotidyltransferase (UPF0157 family)
MNPELEKTDTSHTEVIDYDPKWVEKYEEESEMIKTLFGNKIISFEHIGSTSIPGLASKPIIDMAFSISSWKDVEDLIKPLSTLGYYT